PSLGLNATQWLAVAINLLTAAGAFLVSRTTETRRHGARLEKKTSVPQGLRRSSSVMVSVVLVLTGFSAMGMEILWFRDFSILLGEFRAVFSLLLAVILLGMGAGSLLGGYVQKRVAEPAHILIVVQSIFVTATLLGLAAASARSINDAAVEAGRSVSGPPGTLSDLWFNARPILLVV